MEWQHVTEILFLYFNYTLQKLKILLGIYCNFQIQENKQNNKIKNAEFENYLECEWIFTIGIWIFIIGIWIFLVEILYEYFQKKVKYCNWEYSDLLRFLKVYMTQNFLFPSWKDLLKLYNNFLYSF